MNNKSNLSIIVESIARTMNENAVVCEQYMSDKRTTGNVCDHVFFTNHTEGCERHPLNWYEPVGKENLYRIAKALNREFPDMEITVAENGFEMNSSVHKGSRISKEIPNGMTAYNLVKNLMWKKGLYQSAAARAASELLAEFGIDVIKKPVDSYGKTVTEGTASGIDTLENPTLEDILVAVYGKNTPMFYRNPRRDGDSVNVFTRDGNKAYGDLTSILYAVGRLTGNTHAANNLVEGLDEIANDPC